MKINILGTEYDYQEQTEFENPSLCESDGLCDSYAKKICVKKEYNENAPNSIKDFDFLKRKVKKHEIVHAFLYESGLKDWAEDEKLVDWIAWQFAKLYEVFKQVDAI